MNSNPGPLPYARRRPSAYRRGRAGARTGRRPPRRPPRWHPRPATDIRAGSAPTPRRLLRLRRLKRHSCERRSPTARPPRAASPPPFVSWRRTRRSSHPAPPKGSPAERSARRRRVPARFRDRKKKRRVVSDAQTETTVRGSIVVTRSRLALETQTHHPQPRRERAVTPERRARGRRRTRARRLEKRSDSRRASHERTELLCRDGTHSVCGSRFGRPSYLLHARQVHGFRHRQLVRGGHRPAFRLRCRDGRVTRCQRACGDKTYAENIDRRRRRFAKRKTTSREPTP